MSVVVAPSQLQIPSAIDDKRGTWGMAWFIATEAMLFVMLFFSYAYLGHDEHKWPPEAPKLTFALIMLAVLLSSSVVLYLGEEQEKKGHTGTAKAFVFGTVILGLAFITLQCFEYADHLRTLSPFDNAYGSIFYMITSLHGAHVVLGLLMLIYVLILPQVGPAEKPPHRALHNVGLYWHFVDAVWVVIVSWLYVAPHLGS